MTSARNPEYPQHGVPGCVATSHTGSYLLGRRNIKGARPCRYDKSIDREKTAIGTVGFLPSYIIYHDMTHLTQPLLRQLGKGQAFIPPLVSACSNQSVLIFLRLRYFVTKSNNSFKRVIC